MLLLSCWKLTANAEFWVYQSKHIWKFCSLFAICLLIFDHDFLRSLASLPPSDMHSGVPWGAPDNHTYTLIKTHKQRYSSEQSEDVCRSVKRELHASCSTWLECCNLRCASWDCSKACLKEWTCMVKSGSELHPSLNHESYLSSLSHASWVFIGFDSDRQTCRMGSFSIDSHLARTTFQSATTLCQMMDLCQGKFGEIIQWASCSPLIHLKWNWRASRWKATRKIVCCVCWAQRSS